MILSGIFGHSHEKQDLFDKLQSLTSAHITRKMQFFKNKCIDIVTGETSLLNDQGAILTTQNAVLAGKVFSKNNYQPITKEDLNSATKRSAQSFVDSYWGNYLFIQTDEQKHSATFLRDPVGQFPLFYTQLAGGEILFSSELSIIYKMLNKKPAFNWDYFSRFLLCTFITTEYTAFEGVFELPHGCQLTLSNLKGCCAVETSVIWNPLNYCKGYKGLEDKKKEIINTTSQVIESWTKGSEALFLELSGGLDSSAILLFLKQVLGPFQTLKAINKFHPESGDERRHARIISKALNIELIEFDTTNLLPFSPLLPPLNFHPNWPSASFTQEKIINGLCELFHPYKDIIHLSGHGGDHTFLASPPVTSLSDYVIERGIKGFLTKLKEISTIYRRPLLPILNEVCKGIFDYSFHVPYKSTIKAIDVYKKTPFFNKELFKKEKKISPHPFFTETKSKKILPGKFALIELIYNGLASIKGTVRGNHNTVFYPLFSQPLLELALSTPTYDSYNEGYSRYHFRKSVSDHFKTDLVWRKDKGETSGITQRGLKKNEKYLLELCLEGKLVRTGLIHRELLHKALKDMMIGQTNYLWPITNVISAEIFMEYWS